MSTKIYVKYVKNSRDFHTTKLNLPTGALDSSSATELLTALTEVNHTLGTTILMVTHDPYAASYTDRILYFKDGHIISELQRHDAERRRFYEAIMQESARQDEKR